MWTTLAMTALACAPQQTGELTLTNARPTHGFLGSVRKDADAPKLLPGDAFFISFDIENLKVGEDGRVLYSIGMELTDKNNKVLYKQEPQDQVAYNSLGGSRHPALVATEVGTDTPPGEYTLTGTVTDRAAKVTKKLSRKFEVLPRGFGVVRLGLRFDDKGNVPAPPVGVPGQVMYVNFFAAGFERDPKTKQPKVKASMRVLQDGKPTLEKEVSGVVEQLSADLPFIPMTFVLNLNRSGKFTIELKVTDELGKKTATESFDLNVVEAK